MSISTENIPMSMKHTMGCRLFLGSNHITPYNNDLAGSITVAQKHWVFSGIYPDDPEEALMHICF
jgi:hypothetical protein